MTSSAAEIPAKKEKPKQKLSEVLKMAGKKALGGGIAGALAMVVQVLALMWMRTTINFQHKYGMSTSEAMSTLYAQGGFGRFYDGLSVALLQAPLSRFGDTGAYAGMMALLESVEMPGTLKTLCASIAAANACSLMPRSMHTCGVMPVSRQLSGSGRLSSAGWQYSVTGSSISFRSASVRTPANCAGRSRRGTTPKVS
jgi:hypothetical protein